MVLLAKDGTLAARITPPLWYALGVVNALGNLEGFGQAHVVYAWREPHCDPEVPADGNMVRVCFAGITLESYEKLCALCAPLLAGQGIWVEVNPMLRALSVWYRQRRCPDFPMILAEDESGHSATTAR